MPEISVLMGAFNCASTIGKSIESIQAQTFPDWELIICDDGSADDTVSVVRKYAAADPRIRLLVNPENRKLSYTLNRCLENASGRFCARMDGDDICDPTRFQKQLDFLKSHPEYAFVSTTMKRFDEKGIYADPGVTPGYSPGADDFVPGSPFCHAPVMIRTEAYRHVGGYCENEKVAGVEDYDLWFRLYAADFRGFILGEPLYSMFDGREASRRRSFRRRLNEFYVRKNGYRLLNVNWLKRIYMFKPIILGLLPQGLYIWLRKALKNWN